MNYIDKIVNEKKGTAIINNLLNETWNDQEERYIDANYDTLCKPEYRQPLIEALLHEQNAYCCYCMQNLEESNKISLEHFIPKNCNQDTFARYNHPIFTKNVIHTNSFDKGNKIIPPEKYPHDIAYHNLLVSCKNPVHCNLGRGNKFIRPLVYDDQIMKKVEYDRNGRIFSAEYFKEINQLNLSVEELRQFRQIWNIISKKYPDLDLKTITCQDLDIIVKGLSLLKNPKLLENLFNSPKNIEKLLDYKWFYEYYKSK